MYKYAALDWTALANILRIFLLLVFSHTLLTTQCQAVEELKTIIAIFCYLKA
jgi:hypothetical protein